MIIKFLKILVLTLTCFFSFAQQEFAEIELIDFNTSATYGSGSSVSVHINPKGIFRMDNPSALGTDNPDNNKFVLELSDELGDFSAPTELNEVFDFYTSLINGVLPSSLISGTYKLRVRATQGLTATGGTYSEILTETDFFDVSSDSVSNYLSISSGIPSINNNFFYCYDDPDNGYSALDVTAFPVAGSLNRGLGAQTNDSGVNSGVVNFNFSKNSGSSYTAYLHDVFNAGAYSQNLIIDDVFGVASINLPIDDTDPTNPTGLPIGTYNIEIHEINSQGVSSIYSVVFLWHSNNTNLGNTTSETICLNEEVIFAIDNSTSGIARNYTGSYYSFDYGDGSAVEYYTHAEIMFDGTEIKHIYNTVSCESGQGESGSNFIIQKSLYNKFRTSDTETCNTYSVNGLGTEKAVNVSEAPEASFTLIEQQCEAQPITATNTSILGQWGLEGTCLDGANFDWYVKGPENTSFVYVNGIEVLQSWLVGDDLIIPANQVIPGCWEIYLVAYNQDLCQLESTTPTQTIEIQAITDPDFQFLDDSGQAITEICFDQSVTLNDLSNIDQFDCQSINYNWTISPSSGYTFQAPSSSNSQSPEVVFDTPGVYQVTQTISNLCGVNSVTKPITVLGDPTVNFSDASLAICETNDALVSDGYTLDFSDPSIAPTYSVSPYAPDSYNWTVSGVGVTSSDYAFISGTGPSSANPVLNFLTFGEYLITVEVNGVCGGANSDVFSFVYDQTPVLTNTDVLQVICSGQTSDEVVFNSDMLGTTYSIVTTADSAVQDYLNLTNESTIPAMTLINNTDAAASVVYTVTPIVDSCSGTPVDFVYTVASKPQIQDETVEICSGESFNIDPTTIAGNTVPTNTTYTWTVIDENAQIAGDSDQSTGQSTIGQLLTNNSNSTQTVVYTVTPTSGDSGDCVGDDFLITVNIKPAPTMDSVVDQVICGGTAFTTPIYNSDVVGVDYSWVLTSTSIPATISGYPQPNGSGQLTGTVIQNTGTSSFTLNYDLSVEFEGCPGNTVSFSITVDPAPSVEFDRPNQVICSGQVSEIVNLSSLTPAVNISWSIDASLYPDITGITQNLGTTTIPQLNLTSTASVPIDLIFTAQASTSSSAGCEGINVQYTITVNPEAEMNPVGNLTYCNGELTLPIEFTSPQTTGVINYAWEIDTNIGAPLTGTGDIVPFNATNITNNLQIATVSVTPSYVNPIDASVVCEGAIQTFQISVIPTHEVSISPSTPQLLCVGGAVDPLTVSYTGGLASATPTYQWYYNTSDSNDIVGATLVGTNDPQFTPPNNIEGARYYFCVVDLDDGCNAVPSATVEVIVQDTPSISSFPNTPQTVCVGGSLSPDFLTVSYDGGSGTPTYQWFVNTVNMTGGNPIPDSNTPVLDLGILDTPGNYYYWVSISFSGDGCGGTFSDPIEVKVVGDPMLTIPEPSQTLCENTTPIDLEVTASGGDGLYQYQWYSNTTNTNTGGTALTEANNPSYTPDTSISGQFFYYCLVTTLTSGCETVSNVSEIIINPEPTIIQQPLIEQSVCRDSVPSTLSVNYIDGVGVSSYQWYQSTVCDNTDLATPIVSANSASFTPPTDVVGSVYYFVVLQFTEGGCSSIVSDCALVNVGEIPSIDDVTQTVCSSSSFSVTPTNGGGINSSDVVPNPTLYTWTVNSDPFILGASNNSIPQGSIAQTLENTTNVPKQIIYTVTPISDGVGNCVGDTFDITVTVNPTPTIADETLTTCSSNTVTFIPSGDGLGGTDIVPVNTTYTWTFVDNVSVSGESTSTSSGEAFFSQTLVNNDSSPQAVDYQVTPISDLGCIGQPFIVTIIVDPVPFVLNKTDEICSGTSFEIDPLNNLPTEIVPSGTTYTWTTIGNPNLTGWSDESVGQTTITQALTNTTNIAESITYVVTPQSGSCSGATFEVVVNVLPVPEISSITPIAQVLCSGEDSVEVTFDATVTGSTFEYTLTNTSIPAEVTGYEAHLNGVGTLPALTLTNGLTTAYELVYEIAPTANGCAGNPVQFTITINPSPQVNFDQLDQNLCNETVSVPVALSSPSPDTDVSWTRNSPVGLIGFVAGDDQGTTIIPSYNLENTTDEPIDVIFTATATTNDTTACSGGTSLYVLTINPTARLDAIPNQTICSQSNFNDVFVNSPTLPSTSITYEWTVTSAGSNLSGYTTNAGPIGVSDPIFGETITNASNLAEDLVYTLTPYFDGCAGTTQTFTITVLPTPEIFAMDEVICSEDTFNVIPSNGSTSTTIVPVNTTYTWTVLPNLDVIGQSDESSPQNEISQTLENLSNTDQDLVYVVTPSSQDGCDGVPFELTVTVSARPSIGNKNLGACSGVPYELTPFDNAPTEIVPLNTLYTWTVLPGADLADLTGYSDQTTGVPTINQNLTNLSDESKTIIYQVNPVNGTCDGLPFEVEVVVSPSPFVEDIIVAPICSNDTLTVAPETGIPNPNNIVPLGTTYTWTVVDNPDVTGDIDQPIAQNEISQTLINTSSVVQTVVYTVVPSLTSCDGLPFTVSVDVKPGPFILSGPETQDTQCSGSPFTISPQDGVPSATTIVPVGTQYTWVVSVPNANLTGSSDQTSAVDLISQTLVNTTNEIQQITYSITPEVDGCIGPTFDAVITIEPKPFIPDVVEDLCDASSYILTPLHGTLPDANTIVPDLTTYSWGLPTITGGITGASIGVEEAFFDSGILENPTVNTQTAVFSVTPNYYASSDPTTLLCTGDVFTVTINLFPSPEINEVITTIGCSYTDDLCTSSIEISPVGLAPFTYNWVSLDGNPIVNPTDRDQFDLCPGVYELAITDSSNCTYVYQYEVPPPDPVEFTLITLTDISCNNVGVQPCDGSIEVETVGGITPYNLVEWYTETIPDSGVFDFGPLINVNDPNQLVNACEGNYILKVLDDSGCEFISPVYTINQIVDPIILTEIISNYNGFNIDCNAANSGTITIDLSGGSGVFEYSFVEDATGDVLETDTVNSVSTTLEFDFLIAGDYTLTIEDPNCSSLITRNYTLTQPDELVITATLVDPIDCFGGLATYDITATGGVPPYTGTGLQDVLSGPFTFVVSDANGCEDDFSTVVAEPAELLATYTIDDAPCFGDFGQVNVLPTGGTGILTVNLYDENNIFITNLNTTTGVPVTFNQLANTYFYEVIDENTCRFGPQAITIDEPDPINIIDFEVIQPDCNTTPAWEFDNGSICITITGGTNPFPVGTAWVDNGGGQWCLNNLSAGTYPIDVTDINNCSLQNPFPDITLVRPPEITAVITNTIDIDCDTDTATQINTIIVNGGVPPYQVTWSGGIVDAANPFVMQTSVPGNYSAFVNDQYGIINGCPPIEFPLDPIAFFEFGLADFTMSSANSDFCDVFVVSDPIYFTNISTGDITSFSWNFGDGSPTLTGVDTPVHVYDALGTYTISLTVEDLYGCFDTYFQTIDITKGYEIILPNAFTPNGDGINETIRPVSNCMTKIKMSIYDTWGSLIYVEVAENQDIYGWDGTIDGNPAENGNYIMVVEATTFNGAVIDLNGPVTLIK
jgi:gliding motility-associated-like protein